jgi:hypothetical protein
VRFHLKDPLELERAADYLAKLAGREATVDITKVVYKRSLQANKFYHVMLSYFGTQVGATLEEVKVLIRQLQTDLYQTTRKEIAGVVVETSRSSADFNAAEMATSIDRFRQWAREVAGVDIPAPTDTALLTYMDDVIQQNAAYL